MLSVSSQPVCFLDICPESALQSSNALQTGTITRTDLQSAPLDPSWILGGAPMARSLQLGEAMDGNLSFGLWDCTDGQFLFKYRSDELIHILEGEAIVRAPGMELHLHPGVIVFFPKGSTMHWTVGSYIKKLAIFRTVQPGLLGRIAGKLKQAWKSIPNARNQK